MINEFKTKTLKTFWPRSTMDSIRVSEALDPRSIRGEATKPEFLKIISEVPVSFFSKIPSSLFLAWSHKMFKRLKRHNTCLGECGQTTDITLNY